MPKAYLVSSRKFPRGKYFSKLSEAKLEMYSQIRKGARESGILEVDKDTIGYKTGYFNTRKRRGLI